MALIVSDIDGTILRKGIEPIPAAVARLRDLAARGNTILLVTGRSANRRADTEAVLKQADVPYQSLYMNTIGSSKTEQAQSKEYNMKKILADNVPVALAVDNDWRIRKLYQSLGITTKNKW
jgi:ribonucleotide monophosphatase NagD (HAD superfamily)